MNHFAFGGNEFYLSFVGEIEYMCDNGVGNVSSTGYNPFSVSNSILSITAKTVASSGVSNPAGQPWNSGCITSCQEVNSEPVAGLFATQHGYFEMRCKVPTGGPANGGPGFWPAFVLYPLAPTSGGVVTGNAPPGEIDIFEILGASTGTVRQSIHTSVSGQSHEYDYTGAGDTSLAFHTYGADVQSDFITFYVDGVQTARQATPSDFISNGNIWYINAPFSVGGPSSWIGAPSPSVNATTGVWQIDYVGVWPNFATAYPSGGTTPTKSAATFIDDFAIADISFSGGPFTALTITGISLSNSIISAGAPAGTVVGTLAVTMSSGTFSGTLALGGANASSFSLSGSNTVVTTPASFPTGNNFSLTATATQASASNSPFTTPQPFNIISQSASSGPGPAASSSFITADFTSPTGRTAPKELFGVATGGLGNNYWQTVSQNATLRSQIKALNLPLIRLHSGWMFNSNGTLPDTFSPSQLSGLVSNLPNLFPTGIKIILGIRTNTLNNSTFFNYTRDAISYWKANSTYPVQYVECMNEVDFNVNASTYASCFAGMVDGAQSVDPTILGTGPASAGNQDTSQRTAVINQYNATTGPQKVGFFNHHQYMYCSGSDPRPSDFTVMRADPGPNDLPSVINGTFNSIAGTWAGQLKSYGLFEFSLECGASGTEDRTQTSRGGCFLLSYWMRTAEQTTSCLPWSGAWDLFDDTGANYNWIYPNSLALGAQYYLAQRAIAKIPGNLCRITTNGQSANLFAWATVNGSNFSVPFVNFSNNPVSGSVALSHWPVNSTGSGTVKFYSYPTTDSVNVSGTETNVSVTNGLTSSITIQPRSWGILST